MRGVLKGRRVHAVVRLQRYMKIGTKRTPYGACHDSVIGCPSAVLTLTGAVPSAATKNISSSPVFTSWCGTLGGTMDWCLCPGAIVCIHTSMLERVLLLFNIGQSAIRRAVNNVAITVVARAVARTVPGLLARIPLYDAT